MDKCLKTVVLIMTLVCLQAPIISVRASEGQEMVTITVTASDNNNGELQYAIDSNNPADFGTSNEFIIPAGTSHTIYVKDAAGNVTSQSYYPTYESDYGNDQKINIDLELGNRTQTGYSDYEYITDTPIASGTGSVQQKITADPSDNAERVFYTITTKTGETFYMVIDQGSGSSGDNVYLLDAVTVADLKALAVDEEENAKSDNLLSALASSSSDKKKTDTDSDIPEDAEVSGQKSKNSNSTIIIVIIAAAGGGIYYYFKIYKNKKDETMDLMEAKEIDEFVAEGTSEEENGEEILFDDDESQEYLERLLQDEELDEVEEGEIPSYGEYDEELDEVEEGEIPSYGEYDEELDEEEEDE